MTPLDQLIVPQLLLDMAILATPLAFGCIFKTSLPLAAHVSLAALQILYTGGLFKRFSTTFVLLFQALLSLGFTAASASTSPSISIAIFSILGLFLEVFAFPPLQLPSLSGPYRVGCMDVYLPRPTPAYTYPREKGAKPTLTHVTARLLYPCDGSGKRGVPLFTHGARMCETFMEFGAPPPLKKGFAWTLQHWLMIQVPWFVNSKPILPESGKKLPVVVYSHGLCGVNALYQFQAASLASAGYLVLQVEHQDGSAPLTHGPSGAILAHHNDIYNHVEVLPDGRKLEGFAYVSRRREQLQVRIGEVIDAAQRAIASLSRGDALELAGSGVSFEGMLDVERGVHLVGHSFGGATVLGAASCRPELFRAMVVHDPAVDWLPDAARRFVCSEEFPGTGGFSDGTTEVQRGLEKVPTCWMYCETWVKDRWGHSHVTLEKAKSGKYGMKGRTMSCVIDGARHFEFSDNCLILPAWLTKALMFSGNDPVGKAREIKEKTLAFLNAN